MAQRSEGPPGWKGPQYVVPPSLRIDLVVLSNKEYREVIIFLPGTFLTVFLRDLRRFEGGSRRSKVKGQKPWKSTFLTTELEDKTRTWIQLRWGRGRGQGRGKRRGRMYCPWGWFGTVGVIGARWGESGHPFFQVSGEILCLWDCPHSLSLVS